MNTSLKSCDKRVATWPGYRNGSRFSKIRFLVRVHGLFHQVHVGDNTVSTSHNQVTQMFVNIHAWEHFNQSLDRVMGNSLSAGANVAQSGSGYDLFKIAKAFAFLLLPLPQKYREALVIG